jgi:chromosome segregation ATPase
MISPEEFAAYMEAQEAIIAEWQEKGSKEAKLQRHINELAARLAAAQARIKELEAIVEVARMEQGRVTELEAWAKDDALEHDGLVKRIKELEAERDHPVSNYDAIAAKAVQKTLDERTRERDELRAINAALVAASASGQGVTKTAYQLDTVSLFDRQRKAIFEITIQPGGELHSWEIKNGILYLMWQRPARANEDMRG